MVRDIQINKKRKQQPNSDFFDIFFNIIIAEIKTVTIAKWFATTAVCQLVFSISNLRGVNVICPLNVLIFEYGIA